MQNSRNKAANAWHLVLPLSLALAVAPAVLLSSVPDPAGSIMAGLLGLFLIAAIGMASLSTTREQLREAAIVILDWRYRAFLFLLLLAISALILAMILSAEHPASITVSRMAIGLFTFSLFYSVYYSVWLWEKVASAQKLLIAAVNSIGHTIAKNVRRQQLKAALEWVNFLAEIGKKANGGREKGLVLAVFTGIAEALIEQEWTPYINTMLSQVLLFMGQTVRNGQEPGDRSNTLATVKEMKRLFALARKTWGICPFDYERFPYIISELTEFSVEREYNEVFVQGASALADICIRELESTEDPAIPASLAANYLEKVGLACVRNQQSQKAVAVITQLLHLAKQAKQIEDPDFQQSHKVLFHALSLSAQLWRSNPSIEPILTSFTHHLNLVQDLIPKATAYADKFGPFRTVAISSLIEKNFPSLAPHTQKRVSNTR